MAETFEEFLPRSGYGYETIQDGEVLTVSGGATPTNLSGSKEVKKCTAIGLQIKNTASTNLLVEVFASMDGVVFDDQPYVEATLGANQTKSVSITSGPKNIKIQLSNQDAGNETTVHTRLGRRYG